MKSLLSNLFFAQIGTSALCICGSVYAATLVNLRKWKFLNFKHFKNIPIKNRSASIDQLLINFSLSLYCIFDIFMLAYFGNEMKELRNTLSYCLFECNWIEQTMICKGNILILMELLNKPREIIIGKLYPLNLETALKVMERNFIFLKMVRTLKWSIVTDFARSLQHVEYIKECVMLRSWSGFQTSLFYLNKIPKISKLVFCKTQPNKMDVGWFSNWMLCIPCLCALDSLESRAIASRCRAI